MAEDFESSRQYLQPLLTNNSDERALLLESKNLLELERLAEAQAAISQVIKRNPKNGEAWNVQGILMAQNGDFTGAFSAFNHARQLFVDDDVVINNLAMLAIMQEDYATARDYLLTLYNRGHASQKALHNLVYVLVKLQDFTGAEGILQQEKLSDHAGGLVEALAKVNPRPHAQTARLPVAKPAPQPVNPGVKGKASPPVLQIAAAKDASAPVKDEITRLLESKSGLAKTAVLPETASLSATYKLKEAKGTASPPVLQATAAKDASGPVKDEITRLLESKSGLAKTAVLSETASLSVTQNLKEVSAVRCGRHQGYFRMTLESRQAINFRELPGADKNKRVFELHNVRLGPHLLRAANDIPRKHPDINKLTFYQNRPDTVLIEFEFTHSLAKTKIFRLAANKTAGERLVFDIYYG
ncbi:tetratricopeptide repeat protein [Gibbsiella quercinecans]|nr:tetratricopeptide repeat protein [Gibbsiella quercinecans]